MRIPFRAGALVAALAAVPAAAADVEHGKELFQACIACHGDGERGGTLGPSLKGVVGRKAASRDDFRYSPALQRSNLVWDEPNLREYLADPQAKVKGNRMPYSGLGDAKDLDDVVAYLTTLK